MVSQRSVLSSDEEFIRLVVPDLLIVQKTLNGLRCIARQKSRAKPLDTLLRITPIKCEDFVCQLSCIALVAALLVSKWIFENFKQVLDLVSLDWILCFFVLTEIFKRSGGVRQKEIPFNFYGFLDWFSLSLNFRRCLLSLFVKVLISLNLGVSGSLLLFWSFDRRFWRCKHRISGTTLSSLDHLRDRCREWFGSIKEIICWLLE